MLVFSANIFALQQHLEKENFPRTDPKIIGLVYQMLRVIDWVFTRHQIPYWVDGGTALGAVRHQGMIPWDDDADLVFPEKYLPQVLDLADEFLAYGFELEYNLILQLYPLDKKYPFIDLFPHRLCKDKAYHFVKDSSIFREFYWLAEEVNPLVRVPFGPIMLNAPNTMIRYLNKGYGEDCLVVGVYKYPHGGGAKNVLSGMLTRQKRGLITDFSPANYVIEGGWLPLQ